MSAPDDDKVVIAAGSRAGLDRLGPKARARVERIDGPFEPACCNSCGGPCMVGRNSRAMLAAGRAEKIICVDCLVKLAERLKSEDIDE